jgi:hypothetical protein
MATVKEAAKFFGISEVTFYALVDSGFFLRMPRGKAKYDLADCARRITKDWQRLKSHVATASLSKERLALLREQCRDPQTSALPPHPNAIDATI